MDEIILIKQGELWIKGKNRKFFIKKLILNIKNTLNISSDKIDVGQGRIYISASDEYLEKLKFITGISGWVKAKKADVSMENINNLALKVASEEIEKGYKTFKVNTSRSLKSFEKDSMEINALVGQTVLENFNELNVDIHNPGFEIKIEVRKKGLFVYSSNDQVSAVGGLPVGTSSRGLLMLSGGIDSPVAGWMMMKRGMSIDAIYFHTPPYTGDKTKEKILDLAKVLSRWKAANIRVYIPYFSDIQVAISKNIPNPFWTLVSRRIMTHISNKIALENRYEALITGESLGQVASQTIENIASVSRGFETPIMRPLIGLDKLETVNLAKDIETFKISILPFEDCCSIFSSDNPKTKTKPDEVEEMQKKLTDLETLIEDALEKMEIYSVSSEGIDKVN